MRNSTKFINAIILLMLLTLTPMAQIVKGQDYENVFKRVDILPDQSITSDPNDINNIANGSFIKESDLIHGELDRDSIYYGPFAASSLFTFNRNRCEITLSVTYNFNSEDIMNGCSNWILRIPIYNDRSDFDSLYGIIASEEIRIAALYDSGDNRITWGEYGIYIEMITPIIPNIDYTITLFADMSGEARLITYLTIEKYQTTTYTNINFVREDINENEIFNYNERIHNIYFAFSFIFLQGIGNVGFYGLELEFNDFLEVNGNWTFDNYTGTNNRFLTTYPTYANILKDGLYTRIGVGYNETIVLEQHLNTIINSNIDGNDTNESHISVYLPFRTLEGNKVDWAINVSIASDTIETPNQTKSKFLNNVDGGTPLYNTFLIEDTENYLLFSTPFNITGNTTITRIQIRLQPNGNITLINSYTNNPIASRYDNPYTNTDEELNYFIVVKFTQGQWVNITPTELFNIFNYGWGKANLYPGEVTLRFSMQTISFTTTGNLAQLKNRIDGSDSAYTGWDNFINQIKSLPGRISGSLKWVWDGIKQIGNFIYTQFLAFKDWIISIIGHTKKLATNIMYAMPFVMPAIIIIAIVRINTDDDLKLKTNIDKKVSRLKETRKVSPISKKSRIQRIEKKTEKSKLEKKRAEAKIKELEGRK